MDRRRYACCIAVLLLAIEPDCPLGRLAHLGPRRRGDERLRDAWDKQESIKVIHDRIQELMA